VEYSAKIVNDETNPTELPSFMTIGQNSGTLSIFTSRNGDKGEYTVEVTAMLANRFQKAPMLINDDTPAPWLYADQTLLPDDLIYKTTYRIVIKVVTKGDTEDYLMDANTAPYLVDSFKPENWIIKEGAMGFWSFNDYVDQEDDPVFVDITLPSPTPAWMFANPAMNSVAVFPMTNCLFGDCVTYTITVTVRDVPTDPSRVDDGQSTTYTIPLVILPSDSDLDAAKQAVLAGTDAEVIDVVDTTGATEPAEPTTVVTATGEEIPLDTLTDDALAQINADVEAKEQ
jgi:hypothetical protein